MTNTGRARRLPLTAAQSGLWYAQQMDPGNPVYAIAEYLELDGPLDVAILGAALRQAVLETESLHLRFGEEDGEPWQEVRRPEDWWPTVVDLTSEPDPAEAARRWMRDDLARAQDVLGETLFAEVIFRLGAEHHFVYQRVHHLLLDGYGAMLVLGRVTEIHDALAAGTEPGPSPFGSLSRLLEEEADYREDGTEEADHRFWSERMADAPDAVGLAGAPVRMPTSLYRVTDDLPARPPRGSRPPRAPSAPACPPRSSRPPPSTSTASPAPGTSSWACRSPPAARRTPVRSRPRSPTSFRCGSGSDPTSRCPHSCGRWPWRRGWRCGTSATGARTCVAVRTSAAA
ncbi:hypothetical protein KGD82_02305 [Nocardiopsis eucommiae]|uniref:Condensation domain-containing protein n=1 Tax=Nocardiopsis eucommiae TaxID=2831970 RepID=A0A975L9C2_9ACTN|nr:hypothetical protein KGD82_02305 [Nocardiopsis eucommiae]